MDTDNSGTIDYTEFLASMMEEKHYFKEAKLREAFNLFDANKNVFISAKNIKEVLGKDDYYKIKQEKFWENLVEEAD